ncbi:MAG TPA: mucoidy inhibitor MuiA family protein [Chthoniobacterales bacterium]
MTEVTVYPDRAQVTRTVDVDVPAGNSALALAGLPESLDENSVQVEGAASPPLVLQGTDLRREVLTGAADPQARALEQQVQGLEQLKTGLSADTAALKQRDVYLANLTTAFAKADKGGATVNELQDTYRFYVDETTKSAAARQSLQYRQEEVGRELDRAKQELARLNQARTQHRLLISVSADAATHAQLQVHYLVPDASWQPAYDARVSGDGGPVQLTCAGLVRQRTGEDWTGVILTLSTAQPALNGRMPDFEPVYLRFLEPLPMANPAPGVSSQTEARAFSAAAPKRLEPSTAQVINQGLSVSFRVLLPTDVPSDGEPHRASLQQLTLEGKPADVTSPVFDETAFLRYHLTNRSDAYLLAGDVTLYRAGALAGRSTLGNVPGGSEFDLDFGRDQNLKVLRKIRLDRRSSSGLINRRDARERKVEVTVENYHPGPFRVTLYDRLPVSQNADISVNDVAFSEPPTAQEPDTGRLTWEFELPGRGKKVITFSYTIQWPQGKALEEGH